MSFTVLATDRSPLLATTDAFRTEGYLAGAVALFEPRSRLWFIPVDANAAIQPKITVRHNP
jgi:hypothetical protein